MGGAKTSNKKLYINNSAFNTLDWKINSQANWINCSPSSGIQNAIVDFYINPTSLLPGIYKTKVEVSSLDAFNSPQFIDVTLNVYQAGSDSLPFGSFDTPVEGSVVSGNVPVTGWALDDIEVTRLEIKRSSNPEDPIGAIGPDGLVYIGDALFVEGARPDIENKFPIYPLKTRAGWGYMLLSNMFPNKGNGDFTLYAYAYDGGGHCSEIGRKTIKCDNANRVKPFGTLDTPFPGEIVNGNDYVNFGWALTSLPKMIPLDGSTISVWVDGVTIGKPVYNQYREDVAKLFPEYKNSQGAVGYYHLDTTKYKNGVHTIAWIVKDDVGDADGIGSRYFTIFNKGISPQSYKMEFLWKNSNLGLYESVKNLPVRFEPIRIKKGFNLEGEPEISQPDNYGTIRFEMREVERVELDLGKGRDYRGYLVVGEELRPLPVGSTLDHQKGTFSWMPGPGFVGAYELLFLQTDEFGITRRISIKVTIRPKF